ncbi:hypothetical protein VOLCADRAFT_118828 [Volvox carteri f. nagariensis]|uniref:Peptidase M11 gametolysin domain-containing protein n=1 Tax=Volvox carteri f. nagariensis TaxID=3068 RepID=D8U7Q6_VOLCA|nr:uncharacterized protein VOLCADRAFT_118828 [Volvox carteri f. nagariensis]EFJ44343.1 hypothetical protein VOLCADRAFT_118828 [Volvox carteri f. nagariensis]|eukprot:XP_002954702.1 hypothetical protein VOLCADRAFT_118828 [Volvox carteri f. nagariensis]
MAPKGLLFLAALFVGAFLAFPGSTTGQLLLAGRQSPPPPSRTVNVTVYVEGTVVVYVSHGHPNQSSNVTAARPPPKMEITHTLTDKMPNGIDTVAMRIDFGGKADSLLTTGDVIRTPITIGLSATQATQLGLATGGSKSGRRLLSEAHERARRMVLEFHNTRRSLQQAKSLLDLLRSLNVTSLGQSPKSSVENVQVLARATNKDLFVVNGQQQNISSLTFVFKSTSCGVFPALNATAVRQWWFDGGGIVATMQRYYNACSYNQVTFRPENNLVFDVDIPCMGNVSMGIYDLKNGSGNGRNLDNELYGMVELAKQYLQTNQPALFSRWSSFRRKIFFFPFNWFNKEAATFGGLAVMGCSAGAECYTWINNGIQDQGVYTPVLFQELGHNIGLSHSSRWDCQASIDGIRNVNCTWNEYGDPMDPMGTVPTKDIQEDLTCTNAPQAYKAGWARPIANGQLNLLVDLKPGIPRDFTLPPMALSPNNMLRIVTDGTTNNNATSRALFVSFRVNQAASGAYDSGLGSDWTHFAWVHEFNDTGSGIPANLRSPPVVMAALVANARQQLANGFAVTRFTQVLSNTSGVSITLKSRTASQAVVSVCRFVNQTEEGWETCSDGIDNDWYIYFYNTEIHTLVR